MTTSAGPVDSLSGEERAGTVTEDNDSGGEDVLGQSLVRIGFGRSTAGSYGKKSLPARVESVDRCIIFLAKIGVRPCIRRDETHLHQIIDWPSGSIGDWLHRIRSGS